MNVREEINNNSREGDKPVLFWLLYNYRMQSEWRFVAYCVHEKCGIYSYQTNRIWKPTIEGKALYEYFKNKG